MTELLEVEIRPGWKLSSGRSLYLVADRTLVIADLHWGYADSHRRGGNLLPLWGNEEIERRLQVLLDHYQPSRMIWLGDSLHTPSAAPLAEAFLDKLPPGLEPIILAGNHDRKWSRAERQEFRLGDCLFHHGDIPRVSQPDDIEIIGHLHPAITMRDGAGLRLKVPALVEGPGRLILPSFSDWSAGSSWNGRLEAGDRLWLISKRRIWVAKTGGI